MATIYPSAEYLVKIVNAADHLATTFRNKWTLLGSTSKQNPGRLFSMDPPDLRDPDVFKQEGRRILDVLGAPAILRKLLAKVTPADPFGDLENADELRNAYPGDPPTETTVSGWPYDVSEALARLHSSVDDLKMVDCEMPVVSEQDVQRLEASAKMLHDAVQSDAEKTPAEQPIGADGGGEREEPEDTKGGKEEEPKQPKPIKSPCENALIAWRLKTILGLKTQTEISETMKKSGIRATQGQVSKWLREVDACQAAGYIPPDPPHLDRKPEPIDPGVIDMGAREDGRTPRQRHRRDPDAD